MVELTLSSVFYKPNEELMELLLDRGIDDLKDMLMKIGHVEKAAFLEIMKNQLSKEDYLRKLKTEYNMLFFGPGKLLAPPYSSVYIDGLGQVETKTTKRVSEIYRAWGVQLNQDFKEPVDHVAIEISFLHQLNVIYAETGNLDALAQKQEFLIHMNKWLNKFADQINAHQTLEFYGAMGEILVIYIEEQLKKMNK